MANIRVKKTVLNKEQFNKAVDSNFTSFVDPTVVQDNDTVEEFFRLYSKLYYEIPIEGSTASHTYILQESSKLVNIEKDLTDVQPLLDEITELRERLLLVNQQMIEIQTEAIEDEANHV